MDGRWRGWVRNARRVPAGCWVSLFTLPALLPLAQPGLFLSHDGLFHAYRLAALDQAVRAGAILPRWFPTFAFGYGHPVLNYYGPLSYYWGLAFTLLGLTPAQALEVVFATGLVASALAMLLFARLHLGRGPAVVAALAYTYLPYHLVDLYVRGAVAEFLAFVWFPLVLWAFHRLLEDAAGPGLPRLALAAWLLAALVTTHNLSALIFLPLLLAYVTFLVLRRRPSGGPSGRPLAVHTARVALALGLAVAISAVYWLPVLAESDSVGLATTRSLGYRDHLLPTRDLVSWSPAYPYPTQPGASPVFPLGLAQAAVIASALALLLPACRARLRGGAWAALLFLVVALASAGMLATASLPVWKLFEPVLAYLQYPWRFLALTAIATAFLAGAGVEACARPGAPARPAAGILLVLILAVSAAWKVPVDSSSPDLSDEAMWRLEREVGQVGSTWTGEFLPVWVQEQRWAISHPAAASPGADGPLPAGIVLLDRAGHAAFDLSLRAPGPATLVLHQFHFPGWRARWQGSSVASRPVGVLGLAAFDLPEGDGALRVRLGLTAPQGWGTGLSLGACLALGAALAGAGLGHGPRRTGLAPGRRARRAGLAAAFLLPAVLLSAGLTWPNGRLRELTPINANLGNTVELLSFETGRSPVRPGEPVAVTLYWRALRSPAQDYKAFVHLTDAALTRQPAQHDGDPGGGFSPTTRWVAGELVPDTHRLSLPADLAPGVYRLWAGMYAFDTMQSLEVLSSAVPVEGSRVLLGEIRVAAP